MRVVQPLLLLASLHATDAGQTCRFSVNVANVANPTQAPLATTATPVTTARGNTTNGTDPTGSLTTPPLDRTTTVVPGTTTTTTASPTATTLNPDKTPTPSPVTTITSTTASPTTTQSATTPSATTTPAPTNTTSIGSPESKRRLQVAIPSSTPTPLTTPLVSANTSTTSTPATAVPGRTTTTSVPSATSGGANATNTTTSTTSTTPATIFDMVECDETFYGLWAKKGLTCGGIALDVAKAMGHDCMVYRGTLALPNSSTGGGATCFSSCFIPACIDKEWNYDDSLGIDSSIYSSMTFSDWFTGSPAATLPPVLRAVPTSAFEAKFSCEKYSLCQCPAANIVTSNSTSGGNSSTSPTNGGGGGGSTSPGISANDVWSDGTKKTNLDYAGQVTSSVSTSVTYTTIAATTTMAIASSVGVVSSSASAAAAGVSTAGASNTLRLIATQMSFSTFTWFSFGDDKSISSSKVRVLVDEYRGARDESSGGMFEYTSRLGIKPHMLMYVTLAGVASVLGAVGVLLILALLVGGSLSCIGALVLVAVISQYALGMVCMFQICMTLKNTRGAKLTAELFVALSTLLVLALGIILYGLHIVRKNEADIQDIGTAAHFDKSIHKRFGTLYDQYTFENRYFFVAKMSLALMSGMVTGTIAIEGKTQLILLIAMHVAFFLLLEVRKPHSAKFVQNTSVMIVILKVVVFGLSFFLLTAATENLPWSVQNVVSYVILSLQLVVLLCLLARQVYIFWKTRQIKNQKDDGDVVAADEITPPHLQLHAFDSIPTSNKHGQREWTSEYYSDQNCRAPAAPPQQQRSNQQASSLRDLRPAPGHVNGKRVDDGHDPNEYAI
ncbi:hypothetical protein DYB30_004726 [Aphanomyces astaci]|uniref:TRP C-terminal domain-containing protein n=1 Tax=Aphanomyces astaci TaxID=112090 RepID=A0A397ECH5_APHAT|nr:hypothetical protein DYB30_004726 [Aphanomyces astaci]